MQALLVALMVKKINIIEQEARNKQQNGLVLKPNRTAAIVQDLEIKWERNIDVLSAPRGIVIKRENEQVREKIIVTKENLNIIPNIL